MSDSTQEDLTNTTDENQFGGYVNAKDLGMEQIRQAVQRQLDTAGIHLIVSTDDIDWRLFGDGVLKGTIVESEAKRLADITSSDLAEVRGERDHG